MIGKCKDPPGSSSNKTRKERIPRMRRVIAPKTSQISNSLMKELGDLKERTRLGYELNLEWIPGFVKYQNGKQLVEEVVGDTIFIYSENLEESLELVRHGFAEWILNQHTRPHRQLINKLITLFEEQQYEKKEKTVKAIERLLDNNITSN